MVVRQGNRWDGELSGFKFRLRRDDEAYRRAIRRSEGVPFQDNTENRGQFNTRGDTRTIYQTAWSDGAFWNNPLLSAASLQSYHTSEGVDVTSVPGDLVPLPTFVTDTSQIGVLYHAAGSVAVADKLYAAGAAVNTNLTLRVWNGSTWAALSEEFPKAAAAPTSLFYDQNADSIVALHPDGDLTYVARDDSTSDTIMSVGTLAEGANGFMHLGRMMIYTGDTLVEIKDPYGSPSKHTITDDGMGPEWLNNVSTSADVKQRLVWNSRLAIATGEGVYYIKNVEQEGLPTAFVYRVDRTADGIDLATPIGTLPPGMIVLDVGWHLGSLLMSCTSDADLVMRNDLSNGVYPRIDFYHLTNGQFGAIGSPLGGTHPDEAPYRFAGIFGAKMYIGGQKRVWVYDAIAGGLHPLFVHKRTGVHGGVVTRAFNTTSNSARVLRFVDTEFAIHDLKVDSGVGADSQTRMLESIYFDFNIPAEQKTVTHVTLMTDGIGGDEKWTVQLSTDDGSFVTVAEFDDSNGKTEKQRLSSIQTGYRFRYKLSYTATDTVAAPSHVKGVVFHAIQGEMVSQWALQVDGTEFVNVENTPVRPHVVLAELERIAWDATVVQFTDSFRRDPVTFNVRIDSVTVARSAPQETDVAQIVLTEDT